MSALSGSHHPLPSMRDTPVISHPSHIKSGGPRRTIAHVLHSLSLLPCSNFLVGHYKVRTLSLDQDTFPVLAVYAELLCRPLERESES
jgi:hypothetical protein